MRDYDICKSKCRYTIPDALVCKPCKDSSKRKGYTVRNVLFCTNQEHKKGVNLKDFMEALEVYLKGFVHSKHDGNNILGINSQ